MKTVIENGTIRTLCRQCDMHCGLNIHIVEGAIEKITGFALNPQNRGRICPKAPAAKELVYNSDRLLKPLKQKSDGTFSQIPYEKAMDEIAEQVIGIKTKYGARSMGVWTGEAVGFLQQADYARRFIHAFGSPNYFSAESVCFASRYIACRLVQGFYNPVPDFAHANLILLWGINPGVTHLPYMLLIDEALKKGAKLIVIDPRRTAAAQKADLFVQIYPGTDGALAWGLAHYLIQTGAYDRDFVKRYATGFEQFKVYAKRFTPDLVAAQTGVHKQMVLNMARMMAKHRPRVVHAPGISLEHQENGLNNLRTIACLSGLSGAIDIKGGEVWPEAPKTKKLPLYDELPLFDQKPIGAELFSVLYQFRKECHSMTAMDYMLGKGTYPLRGLILTGTNPVLTNPNSKKVTEAFSSLDLLVSRELFMTKSASLAHYIIPAASFLERSELHWYPHRQRIAMTTKVLDDPGITDEYTFWHDLAQRLGFAEKYFPWQDETEVNRWLLESSKITLEQLQKHPEGISYGSIEYQKYQHRPFLTPTGKYEFTSHYLKKMGYPEISEYMPPPYRRQANSEYPFVLITGARSSFYYHSRYRNIRRFRKAIPEAEIELHPKDAERLQITNKEHVRLLSPVGSIETKVKIVKQEDILPGVLQVTHGWDEANVNLLTDDTKIDPISGLPNMKIVMVRLEKI
jgi:anaerobic selenocysteine-containing dehydrogenase